MYYCDCKKYVEASICSGQTTDIRVWVHQDDLPASISYFKLDGVCWSINPNDPLECLPTIENGYVYDGAFDAYVDCAECVGDGGGDDTGTGWWPGSGGGLSDIIWWGDGPTSGDGIKATVCADHLQRAIDAGWDTDNLYIWTEEEFSSSFILRVSGICVSVPTGPVVNVSNVQFIDPRRGRRFDICSDCTDGAHTSLCAKQASEPGSENAPDFWVLKGDLPDAPDVFQYAQYCYEVPGTTSLVPADKPIIRPQDYGLTCTTCGRGIPLTECAEYGTEGPGIEQGPFYADIRGVNELVEAFDGDDSPAYIKINGVCYELDLSAEPVDIPPSATLIWPKLAYASCWDCICRNGRDPRLGGTGADFSGLGLPVHVCSGQDDDWDETWIRQEHLPTATTYWSYGGLCVYVNPSETLQEIPLGVRLTAFPSNTYDSCQDCSSDGGGDPDDDDNCPNPPCPPPPPPPPPPPGDEEYRYFQLYECGVGNTTLWVHLPRFTNITAGKYNGACYAVKKPGKVTLPANGQVVGLSNTKTGNSGCGAFAPCECEPCYTIQDCNYELPPRTVDNDLSAHVGEVGFLNDRCWEVSEGDAGGMVTQFNPDQWYPDCTECKKVYWLVGDICDSGYSGGSLYTRQDFSAHLNKYVKVNGGDNCFEVRQISDTGQTLTNITVDEVFDSCAGCQPSCCTCGDCEFDDEIATISNYVWEGTDTDYYGDGACNPPALKITTRFTQSGPATRLGCGRWSVPLTYFQEILDPDGNTSTDGPFPAGDIEVKLNCGTMEWTGGQQGEVASGSCSGVNYNDVYEYCNGPNYRTEINWSFDITGNTGCDDMP